MCRVEGNAWSPEFRDWLWYLGPCHKHLPLNVQNKGPLHLDPFLLPVSREQGMKKLLGSPLCLPWKERWVEKSQPEFLS